MDDLSISVSSTSLKKNIRLLDRDIASLFDAAKTELIHFTTRHKAANAVLTLPDYSVVTPRKVVR